MSTTSPRKLASVLSIVLRLYKSSSYRKFEIQETLPFEVVKARNEIDFRRSSKSGPAILARPVFRDLASG